MPPDPPLRAELVAFLARPRPAVIATLRRDGSPVTSACWFEWTGKHLLLPMLSHGVRVRHVRRDPRLSLTVLGEDWYAYLTLYARVVSMHDDVGHRDIDRIAQRHWGRSYGDPEPITTVVADLEGWRALREPR